MAIGGPMRCAVLVALVIVVGTACGSTEAPAPRASPPAPNAPSPAPTTTPTPIPVANLGRAGCPVSDDAFCDTATRIGQALLDRNAEALLRLSRSTTIECAEIAREYFPGCADADVLTGYGVSGADFSVDVVPRPAYARRLDALVAGIDPSFSDELGGGAPSVIGVGTCGPNIPGRRTYHVAWTAAIGAGGGSAERHLGSFEVTFENDRWRVALWYLDPLEAWEAEQPDPAALAFCEAGLHPWDV
jgi:hypothetical protein